LLGACAKSSTYENLAFFTAELGASKKSGFVVMRVCRRIDGMMVIGMVFLRDFRGGKKIAKSCTFAQELNNLNFRI
jgi:hypothetical protein